MSEHPAAAAGRGATASRWRRACAMVGAGLVVVVLTTAGGCASAPPASPAQASLAAAAPTETVPVARAKPPAGDLEPHIEDALAELRVAERAVDASLAPPPEGGRSAPVPSATWRPAWPSAPPPASSAPPALTASAAPAVGPELLDDSLIERCVTACNALQSMRRSAKLLCELTGPGDARCSAATDRVGIARGKVRASCGACAD